MRISDWSSDVLLFRSFQPVEEPLCPVPLRCPGVAPALPVGRAAYDPLFFGFVQIAPGRVQADTGPARVAFQFDLAFLVAGGLPRFDGALPQSFGFVGHHQPVIDADDAPETPAGIASSEERRVGKACVSTCRSRCSPYH